MVDDAGYNIRLAGPDDVAAMRASVRVTLANPEGKPQRKRFDDSIDRGELLIMERNEGRGAPSTLLGFIEWRGKTDGSVTIRDFGTAGGEPQLTILRRLVREMLRLVPARPGEVHLKTRTDQEPWTTIIRELPGFDVDEREFSRGVWWTIWVWNGEPQRPPRNVPPNRRR